MKIQKILTSLFAAAAILCSCEKEQTGQQHGNIKADLKFTLALSEVTYNSAQVRVSHDGTTEDTWYGFITDEVTKSDVKLIAAKIAELTANSPISKLESRTSKRVNLNNLEPATDYKYIVFAITPDGELYGEIASIDIKTGEGFLLKTVEDWTISRDSRDLATNKETYNVQFNRNGAPRCHVGFIPKLMVEAYEKETNIQEELANYGGLRLDLGGQVFLFSILDYLVFEELYEYWGYYDGDESYFNQETFDTGTTFTVPRQSSGTYYAVAIGFNDGVPTFTYSVNEIEIEKETASEEYKNWLGRWEIIGSNKISYTLKFEENDPNYSYYVYGWECSDSIHEKDKCPEDCSEHTVYTDFSKYELGIPFYFDALNGDMFIQSVLLGGEASTNNTNLYWGMFGYTEYEENTISILTQDDKIASAAQPTDTTAILNGLASTTYNTDESGNITDVNFTYKSLGYVMYDDKTFTPSPWNLPLELPATLIKVMDTTNEEPATPVLSSFRSRKEASAIKSYTSIQKADYSRLVKADFLNR